MPHVVSGIRLAMANDLNQAVGIDLGTTFSVVAHLEHTGRPVSLRSAEGDLTTPSVVLFDEDGVIVEKEALKALSREAEHTVQCAKRDLGLRVIHKAIDGRQYPPEVIQAYVLKKLKDDARRQIGDFHQAVITVPAYLDDVRRNATKDAGYMAGLDVLDIINEPTAAALAYGIDRGFLSPEGKSHGRQVILVYDLGGGTFDVTVMAIEGTSLSALATDGDVQLGGHDWDQRLVDFIAQEFSRLHGFDPRAEPNLAARLWLECEDAKRTLSARHKTLIACTFKGHDFAAEITREQFQELTADLLSRTEFTTREVLKAAGCDWGRVDRILLVGGSTRMPAVVEMLRRLSGKEPDASLSADETVAHGAALHAGLLSARHTGCMPTFKLRNVNSHSLGVVARDRHTGDDQNVVLIERNTPLPAKAKRVFRTQKHGQKSILVRIVEGESPLPESCTALGRCVVRDLPPTLPARTPIEVRFRYGPDGRLSVKVHVAGTDSQLEHEILRENSLSQSELKRWRKEIVEGL